MAKWHRNRLVRGRPERCTNTNTVQIGFTAEAPSQVLQTDTVFSNVSKGQAAPTTDLQTAFKTTDSNEIALLILRSGELQVGGRERAHELAALRREVCTLAAERCIDPASRKTHYGHHG